MDRFDQYLQYQKELAKATIKIIEQFQGKGETKPSKRISKIKVAENVLKMAGRPLHVSDMIKMAEQHYQVQLNRDSIVSAMLKKADVGQTFVRTEPNTFSLLSDTNQ